MCVLSALFQSAIPLVKTEKLFLLSNANPPLHFAFLHSSPYSEAPSLNSRSYCTLQHAHTHMLSFFFTSDVVLSVVSPVDHLVVVIEEVFCNSSVGSIIGTKKLTGGAVIM